MQLQMPLTKRMKKVLGGDANTARWRSQKFCPAADLLPGARDGQNLISWRWSLPLPTNPVGWESMHAVSSYHGNRPTNIHTHKQTGRTNYNTLRRSFAILRSVTTQWTTVAFRLTGTFLQITPDQAGFSRSGSVPVGFPKKLAPYGGGPT